MRSILLVPELNWRSVKNNDNNNNKKPDMLDVSMKIQTVETCSSSSLERPCLDSSEHNDNNNTNNNNIGGSSSVGKHHNNNRRRCTIESDYYYEGNNNNENRGNSGAKITSPSPSPSPSPSSPTHPRGVGNSENDNRDNNDIRGDDGGPTTTSPLLLGRKIMLKRQADGSPTFLILDCNNNNNNNVDDATTTTGGNDSSSSNCESIARKKRRREERSPSMGGECAISVEDNVSVRYFVTPWTLWYYVYAGGISLFIFGYAINGLSIFSEISVIISSVVLYPMMFRGKKMEKAAAVADYCFPIHYISALGMGSSAIIILFAAVILDPQNYDPNVNNIATWEFWILSGNLWVGILFPMVASIFLCKCSPIPSVMAMSAKRVLTFGMPSMAMMSIMFLSFYFTAENNKHKRDQLDYFKEWRLFFADNVDLQNYIMASLFSSTNNNNNGSAMNNNATSAYGLMWLWNSNTTTTTNSNMGNMHNNNIIINNNSSNSGPNFQDFMRVGKGLEEALFEKSNFVVLLSSFMAPFLLWASVVTFIRAAMAGISDVQSVFSGYVLVFAAKHYILSSPDNNSLSSSPTLFVAAVAVAVPPCLITLFAETWKRSSFYSGGYPAAAFSRNTTTTTNNNNDGDCGGVDYYGGAGDCMIPSSSRKKKRDFSISV